jgi:hypothetical protein
VALIIRPLVWKLPFTRIRGLFIDREARRQVSQLRLPPSGSSTSAGKYDFAIRSVIAGLIAKPRIGRFAVSASGLYSAEAE